MRALNGGLARCYKSHHNALGRAYQRFCRPWVDRCGGELPAVLAVPLRELWRLSNELNQIDADREQARARHRRTEERRLRRAQAAARRDFARLLSYIERVIEQQPSRDWTELLKGGGQ